MESEYEEGSSFVPALIGAIIGGLIVGVFCMWWGGEGKKTPEEIMGGAYHAEELTRVSPSEVRGWIESGNEEYVIVDLRASADYERGHVVGAISIPATTLTEEALVDAFKTLPEGKTAVVYCYSAACMLATKTAHTLAHNDIYVKHMTIGWNEWRYDWKMWNGQNATTDPLMYAAVGKEPGVYAGTKTSGCDAAGGEGC